MFSSGAMLCSNDFFLSSLDINMESLWLLLRSDFLQPLSDVLRPVLPDANLERYGIRPEEFRRVLTSNPEVNTSAIFLGSLGDQADR